MTELESRIAEAKALQSRVKPSQRSGKGTRTRQTPELQGLSGTYATIAVMGLSEAHPRIRYFREERKYAMPQHISGNARNRLVFGKVHWIDEITEQYENEIVRLNADSKVVMRHLAKRYGYRK